MEIATPAGDVKSGSARVPGTAPPVASRTRGRGWWWLVTALAVCAAFVLGGFAEHIADQRNAARTLYQAQVTTTVFRLLDEENSQLDRPVAQRSAAAFGDVTDAINGDLGVNGAGTLQVTLGAGSAAPLHQIAFSATVASPYGSTTFAVWSISLDRGTAKNQGACVLSSSLLGSGRATTALDLGGGEQLQPCAASWWSPGPVNAKQPQLGLAGIPRAPR